MKKLTVFAVLFATPFALLAGEPIDRTLDADPEGSVNMSLVRGAVKVKGWDRPNVQVEGTLDDQTRELVFERDGNEIILKVKLEDGRSRGKESKLTVNIPVGSRLDASSVSADFQIAGIGGAIEIQSISGDMVLSELGSSVEVKTVSGDVSVESATDQIKISSVSGDISINSDASRLEINSVSGDIRFKGNSREFEVASASGDVYLHPVELQKLEVATASGDIKLRTVLSPEARVKMESMSGDIELQLEGQIDAKFQLETSPGGSIKNRLDDRKPQRDQYSGEERLTMTIGSGSGRVEMQTFAGDLKLSK